MYPVAQYEARENSIQFLTAVGNFTGKGHCFASAASTKRLYVYDTTEQPDSAKSYVKIGQKITCLCPCKYQDRECLAIGTDNAVQLFDVKTNTQVFSVLIEDGVSAVTTYDQRYIYVGSNCSILGYDLTGNEVLWTVTGDVVTAMCEIEWNSEKCILAASNDLMIRLFSGEESIRERKVHSKVSFLKALGPQKYAIAFENGSITLINGVSKVWDVASGGQIVGLQVIDYVGKPDIAFATSEGNIGILDADTGRIITTDDTRLRLSGLHLIDFQNDKHMCLLVIGNTGSVRIFSPTRTDGLGSQAKKEFDLRNAQPALVKEKARLLLRQYELTCNLNDPSGSGKGPNVKYTLGQRLDLGCAELQLRTEPPTPIQGTVIESTTSAGGEFVVFETNEPAEPEQRVLMNLPDSTNGELKVDVFVSGTCFSFKLKCQNFFGFQMVNNAKPIGYAEFVTSCDVFRKFVSTSMVTGEVKSTTFRVCFQSLEKHEPLVLSSDGTKCRIESDTIETAAKIITEYCNYAKLTEFECIANFQKELKEIEKIAKEDLDAKETGVVHKAEVAGMIAQLKDIVVRIENAEIIGQYQTLYDSVIECERLNEEIAREHVKRMTNREALGSQRLNAMIQKFAELRKGNARNALLQLCRKELQNRKIKHLIVVLQTGKAVGSQGRS